MKKIIVLTVVAIASQAVAIFAGEPVVSRSKLLLHLHHRRLSSSDRTNSILERSGPMPKALAGAVTTCTVGEEAWTSLIGFHGNMQVSGSKGRD